MQRISKYILLITGLITLHVQQSKAQVTESDVIGSWSVDYNALNTPENRSDSFHYDSLTNDSKSNLRAAFEGRGFEFLEGQSLVISYQVYGNARRVTGQWILDESSNKVTITAQNRELTYQLKITNNMMYLKPERLEGNAVFKELILKRN